MTTQIVRRLINDNQKEYLRNLAEELGLVINEERLNDLTSFQASEKIRQLKKKVDEKRAVASKPSEAQLEFLNILIDALGKTQEDVPEKAFEDKRECSNQIEILNIQYLHLQLGIAEAPAEDVLNDKAKRKEYIKQLKSLFEASPEVDDLFEAI